MGNRLQITFRASAITGQGLQGLNLAHHLASLLNADRGKTHGAITVDLGENTACCEHHQRPHIGIVTIAHQYLAQPFAHGLNQNLVHGQLWEVGCDVVNDTAHGCGELRGIIHGQHYPANIGFVCDLVVQHLDHHRVVEG
ncbi:hypothetical protein D3C85_1270080 [compost metagenome]